MGSSCVNITMIIFIDDYYLYDKISVSVCCFILLQRKGWEIPLFLSLARHFRPVILNEVHTVFSRTAV